jgi:alpha-D-ribose 1-methylphosphonate 5-triphosphate synthase subunit PhnG
VTDTVEIHATDIATFRAGRYRLMRVIAPGIAKVRSKDGEVDAPFSAGDVIVTDAVGHVLVSPISLAGGVEIATEIMEGRSRTITDPMLQLKLAAVILAYAGAPAAADADPSTFHQIV